ncbi:hypothetical protein T08_1362 [Trichinella sp. T8]|nr:hypothetical protein T08_1362 [Trichinella sp. T8]
MPNGGVFHAKAQCSVEGRFLFAVATLTDCRFCLRCSPPFTHWASGFSASKSPCLRSRILVLNLLLGGSYNLNRQGRNRNQSTWMLYV